jgi:xylulokinase
VSAVDCLLGVDLGTSSVRALLVDEAGRRIGAAAEGYPIRSPRPGHAEQDPGQWWEQTARAIRTVLAAHRIDPGQVRGVGLSGQMHGTVLLDARGAPLRPAVIWPDRRSAEECRRLEEAVGAERLYRITGLPAAAGFMAPTVAWLARHEPRTLRRAARVLLPKDYIRFRLTGRMASEPSDAGGSLLFDVGDRRWSEEILAAAGIDAGLLPPLVDSGAVAGEVGREAAAETGLAPGTPVVAGGSDQAMAALGSGILDEGITVASIGTGGQLVAGLRRPVFDPERRLHTLCHAVPDRWLLMGAILAAGLSLKWFAGILQGSAPPAGGGEGEARWADLDREAEAAPPGSEGLLFLPYLGGERTPHLDPRARGAFIGLTLRHSRGHLARSIMEGVGFAMKQSLRIFRDLGVESRILIGAGGGARSRVWRQILADIFEQPLVRIEVEEHSAFGAALLAGVGVGLFPDAAEAARRCIRRVDGEEAAPTANAAHRARYRAMFDLYESLYPRLKDLFPRLQDAAGEGRGARG